ncbi:MAG: lamin tail domain-containing protein [Ferruginibacter sp.]
MQIFTKNIFSKAFSLLSFLLIAAGAQSQVIITQYYEGTGTNKWIELTNLGSSTVNTASPQLRLGLWAVTGSTGNINITGAPSQVVDLTVIIPAKGSVLIGNPANGAEVPYLTSASASQTNSQVINFNGNDGVALLDASNNIIDAFGTGINAIDRSYYRNLSVMAPNASFTLSEWTLATLATVQAATIGNPERLNYHLENNCTAPVTSASNIVYYSVKASSIGGAYTPAVADEHLVLVSTSPTMSAFPQDGVVYQIGDIIGGARVINRSSNYAFYATGLTPSTLYYFFVFALNSNCTGGPSYNTSTYLTASNSTTAVPATQSFYTYFGNLHAHSGFSDGNMDNPAKTPADDYAFAKESMCMDFLGISEHNHTGAGMNISRWQPGRDQAAAATTTSFLAMYGMEFGVIDDGGHAVVYGMDSLMGWETNQYQSFVARGNFSGTDGLFEKINNHGNNSFVYLAHPEPNDFNNIFNNAYSALADEAVVGVALETGPANSTSIDYNNPGSSMSFLDYYKILLSKGYHVGPMIDHDNHNMTFGRTARTRLAIIAPALTETAVLQAMRQMNFYATQDCSAKISFSIEGQPMGSVMLRSGAPQLTVECQTASPVTTVRIMYGTPGSGSFPTELSSFSTASVSYTDISLGNFGERYYYLEITEADGSRIVTAPIWYTRVDGTLASKGFTAFTAINRPDDVLLKWTTIEEDNGAVFIVERSVDGGRHFVSIGSMPGKGTTAATNEYSFIDAAPFSGLAYYRIRLKDADGQVQLSPQRVINRSAFAQTNVSIYPNPVNNFANIHIYSAAATTAFIELFDVAGKKLYVKNTVVANGEQVITIPVMQLAKGNYVIKVNVNGQLFSRMLNKQ